MLLENAWRKRFHFRSAFLETARGLIQSAWHFIPRVAQPAATLPIQCRRFHSTDATRGIQFQSFSRCRGGEAGLLGSCFMAHMPGGVDAGKRPERPPPDVINVMGLPCPMLKVTTVWAAPRGGGKAADSERAGFCTAMIWPPEADST